MFRWYKEKFGIDRRKFNYSALIRSGQMKKEEALEKLNQKYIDNQDEIVFVHKKIRNFERIFEKLIKNNTQNTFKNFNTSYGILKYFSPMIKILSKLNIVPGTTYYKYFKF